MKRQTKIVLMVFFVLLAVVLLWEFLPKGESVEGIRIDGWLAEGSEVERSEEQGPIDRIEASYKGISYTMTRTEDGKWLLDKPEGARADKWKVRTVIDLFRKPIESIYSTEPAEEELHIYGLSPDKRIFLKLFRKGEVFVSLYIGKSEKPEEFSGMEGDTFLMLEGDKRIYRIAGKNLTRPFEEGLKDFRDKKLFDFGSEEIRKLTLKFPPKEGGEEIVLEGKVKKEAEAADEGKEKKKERVWSFVKPQVNFAPEGIDTLASGFAGLYAQDFVEQLSEGEEFNRNGFSIAAELDDGKTYRVVMGYDGVDHVLAQVEGAEEFIKLSKYSANSLKKRLKELRDKKIFGLRKEDIARIEVVNKEGELIFEREGESWKVLKPAWIIPGEAQINSLLADIVNLRCEKYLERHELKAEMGFDAPGAIVVTVYTGGVSSRKWVLKMGGEKDTTSRYATVEGQDEFFTIANYNFNKFNKNPEDYRNKKIFNFTLDDIEKIELIHSDETVEIVRGEGEKKWKILKPSQLDNLKTDVIDTLAGTLANIQVKDFVKGKKPQDVKLTKGCFEARVTTKSGSQHSLFISEEKKEHDNYARTTEQLFSKDVFTINTYQAKNIMKRAGELIPDPYLPVPK